MSHKLIYNTFKLIRTMRRENTAHFFIISAVSTRAKKIKALSNCASMASNFPEIEQ